MPDYRVPIDAFAIEELLRQYRSADTKGRIALLQSDGDALPFEIARLAVEDPNVEVRQWFARHGRDYRELLEDAGRGFRFSERDLLEILRKDPDTFVRASVYANPAFSPLLDVITAEPKEVLGAAIGISMGLDKCWSEATHPERLGMVRNHGFTSCLFAELKSNQLGLSTEERRELIWAFLAAPDEVRLRKSTELWKLASEWPEETDLQALVYRFLPTDDKTAVEVYQETQKVELRRAILCMAWDSKEREKGVDAQAYLYRSTLEVATKDPDGACRLLAYGMVGLGRGRYWWKFPGIQFRVERFKQSRKLLRAARDDIYALSGLAKNLSLSPRELHRVESRAQTLAHSQWNSWWETEKQLIWLAQDVAQDIKRTIGELRLERNLGKFDGNRLTDESKVGWTQDEKLDYLTVLSLGTSGRWAVLQVLAVASGLGLVVFSVTYIFSHSLALSFLLLLSCSWVGWFFSDWAIRKTSAIPPWMSAEEYSKSLKHLWSEHPRKAPLIEERQAPEVEPEADERHQRWAKRLESYRKEEEERIKRREAHKRKKYTLPRTLKRDWHLLKRRLRFLIRR